MITHLVSTTSRRRFLHGMVSKLPLLLGGYAGLRLTGVGANAAVPIVRRTGPQLKLGMAAYSFRDFLIDSTAPVSKSPPGESKMSLEDVINIAADNRCEGVELTSYYFPKEPSLELLLQLKRHAFVNGVEISGSAVGNRFTHRKGPDRDREVQYVKTWIDHTATMGAKHLRVFAGEAGGADPEQAMKWCIECLEECCTYAGSKGVMLGLENHGGIVSEADDLLRLVKAVKSQWLGINLDTGNFHTADPYADLIRCAPYAVNVQLKSEIHPRNQKKVDADLERLIEILKESNYRGYVTLEYEAAEAPRTAVPRLLGKLRGMIDKP